MGIYIDKAAQIGKLVESKNAAYGNSFEVSGEILLQLWPNGIPTESYTDVACVVRILDKLKRIATHKDYNGESPYLDISGYGILGAVKDDKDRQEVEDLNNIEGEVARITSGNALPPSRRFIRRRTIKE